MGMATFPGQLPFMPSESKADSFQLPSIGEALLNRNRFRILGLTPDDIIKYFFNGNAVVAIIVLALITFFLFREGVGFFGKNLRELRNYRLAGLEYVDYVRTEVKDHTDINRTLNDSRLAQFMKLTKDGRTPEQANEALAPFDAFATAYGDTVEDVRGILSDLTEAATAIKEKDQINENRIEQKEMLIQAGKTAEAEAVVIAPVNFGAETAALTGSFPVFQTANKQFAAKLEAALAIAPKLPDAKLQ
jgi:phosphate transport system permease protein